MPRESVDCAVIAFYDINVAPKNKQRVFDDIVTWFERLGVCADKMKLKGEGFSGKPIAFDRSRTSLGRGNLETISGFSLFSLLPGSVNLMKNSRVQVEFNFSEEPWCLIETRSNIVGLPSLNLLEIAKSLGTALTPAYGIGYRRPLEFGPGLYALGISMGDLDEMEEDQIAGWINFGWPDRIYRRGILRDLYPWNFLTAPQLNAEVGSLPLQEWVRKDKRRGKLVPLTDSMTLWEVADESIPEVRKALWDAGRIIDLESLRPDGPETSAEEIVGELIGDQDPENVGVIRVEKGKKRELTTDEKRTLAKDAKRKK